MSDYKKVGKLTAKERKNIIFVFGLLVLIILLVLVFMFHTNQKLNEDKLTFDEAINILNTTNQIYVCNNIENDSFCSNENYQKLITNKDDINNIISLLSKLTIHDGAISLEGRQYSLIFINDEGKEVAELSCNPGVILDVDNTDFYLIDKNKQVYDMILNY